MRAEGESRLEEKGMSERMDGVGSAESRSGCATWGGGGPGEPARQRPLSARSIVLMVLELAAASSRVPAASAQAAGREKCT